MAVHNGEAHLREAIDSILSQSFTDFEFLILDDASLDDTPNILDVYVKKDARIQVFRNESNLGLTKSLNRLLSYARAPLVARIDGDDISTQNRLEKQIAFLDAHPDHLLVGSGYRSIDEAGRERFVRPNPLVDFGVRWVASFRTPMVHPSFCFRAKYPDGAPVRYRNETFVAQDYALVADLLAKGKVASLEEILVHYRMHDANISSTRRPEQEKTAFKIAQQVMAAQSGEAMARKFLPLHETMYNHRPKSAADIPAIREAFYELISDRRRDGNATWMKRRAASYLAEAYLAGTSGPEAAKWAATLSVAAADFMPALLWRFAETKGWVRNQVTVR
jgi:glycosyltransferase involved in cell wall biosynthesis